MSGDLLEAAKGDGDLAFAAESLSLEVASLLSTFVTLSDGLPNVPNGDGDDGALPSAEPPALLPAAPKLKPEKDILSVVEVGAEAEVEADAGLLPPPKLSPLGKGWLVAVGSKVSASASSRPGGFVAGAAEVVEPSVLSLSRRPPNVGVLVCPKIEGALLVALSVAKTEGVLDLAVVCPKPEKPPKALPVPLVEVSLESVVEKAPNPPEVGLEPAKGEEALGVVLAPKGLLAPKAGLDCCPAAGVVVPDMAKGDDDTEGLLASLPVEEA